MWHQTVECSIPKGSQQSMAKKINFLLLSNFSKTWVKETLHELKLKCYSHTTFLFSETTYFAAWLSIYGNLSKHIMFFLCCLYSLNPKSFPYMINRVSNMWLIMFALPGLCHLQHISNSNISPTPKNKIIIWKSLSASFCPS